MSEPHDVWPQYLLIALASALRRDGEDLVAAERVEALEAAAVLEAVVRGQEDQSSTRFTLTMLTLLEVACSSYGAKGAFKQHLPAATKVLCQSAPHELEEFAQGQFAQEQEGTAVA